MLTATYVVVAFSILVQGTTVGPLMRRWLRPQTEGKSFVAEGSPVISVGGGGGSTT